MLTRHNPSCVVMGQKKGKKIYCRAEAKIKINHISVVTLGLEK